jgi:hypothetical protein
MAPVLLRTGESRSSLKNREARGISTRFHWSLQENVPIFRYRRRSKSTSHPATTPHPSSSILLEIRLVTISSMDSLPSLDRYGLTQLNPTINDIAQIAREGRLFAWPCPHRPQSGLAGPMLTVRLVRVCIIAGTANSCRGYDPQPRLLSSCQRLRVQLRQSPPCLLEDCWFTVIGVRALMQPSRYVVVPS